MSHIQQHQPEMQQHQPDASHPMMTQNKQKKPESIPKAYLTGAAKEAGKETVEELSKSQDFQQTANNLEQSADQKYEDAKARAQGFWTKWLGCLGSV